MGIEVIDLRPDIFQMACGYFSLFINHLFPERVRHDLSQSLGMTGVYMYIVCGCGQGQAKSRQGKF